MSDFRLSFEQRQLRPYKFNLTLGLTRLNRVQCSPRSVLRVRASQITLGINLSGQVKRVRGCQVGVSRSDGQNEASLLGDELHEHVLDLLLNVGRLIPDGDFCHAGQVDQRDVENWKTADEGRDSVKNKPKTKKVRT